MKKIKRTLYKVGISRFDFDFTQEKKIYAYTRMNPDVNEKELSENQKFYSYKEWEAYVKEKYSKYSYDTLKEFQHHLIQRKRNINPTRNFKELLLPIVLPLFISQFIEILISASDLHLAINTHASAFIILAISTIAFVVMIWGLYKLINDFFNDNMTENLYDDYLQVVGELLNEKHTK